MKSEAALWVASRRDIRLVEQSNLFWPAWYAQTYRDELDGGGSAATEYVLSGAPKGRWPSPMFNPALYLLANPDVAESDIPPFLHYLRHGEAEGRALAPELTDLPTIREIVPVGVVEGGALAPTISRSSAERLIEGAKNQSLGDLCLSTNLDRDGLDAFSKVASWFREAGLRVCLRFVEPAQHIGPDLGHSIAAALSDPLYVRCGVRPLIIVSHLRFLREGFLQELDRFLPDYKVRRPLYAIETPFAGYGTNPANLLWFDAVAEAFGDLHLPEYLPQDLDADSGVSYPAIFRSVTTLSPNDDGPRMPSLLFPWSPDSAIAKHFGRVSHYSKDLLLHWARRCAGIAMGPTSPGPILVRHWNGSLGGISAEDAQDAFKAMKQYVLDWTAMATQDVCPIQILNPSGQGPAKPVIVFQMGKVGSTSVYEPLAASYRLGPVFHTHTLCGTSSVLAKMRTEGSLDRATVEHLLECDQLMKAIEQTADDVKWHMITLVREPVARTLSFFLHELWESRPNFELDWRAGTLSHEELRELFFQFAIESSDSLDPWWRSQLQPLTGIDVFATPFPVRNGFATYEAGRFRVLLIRTEDLNRVADKAISDFLGVRFELAGEKLSSKERGLAQIRDAILSSPIPGSILERLLSTRTAQHFYSREELSAFESRWTQAAMR